MTQNCVSSVTNKQTNHFNGSKTWVNPHFYSLSLKKTLFFLSICIHNFQSNLAAYVKKAVKAITDVKNSAKATAEVKQLKIKNAPNQAYNFEIFSEVLY